MFDLMVQQARQVVTSGLSRGELTDLVAGAGRAIAALSALQTRCATEIEALDDGGVNSKTVLREAGRMSTRNANKVAKTAAGLAEMPKLAESLANGAISVEHAEAAVGAAAKTSPQQVDDQLSELAEDSSVDLFAEQSRQWAKPQPTRRRRRTASTATQHAYLQELDQRRRHGSPVGRTRPDQLSASAQSDQRPSATDSGGDDGGREGKPDEVRTTAQRMADAFVGLITEPTRRGPGSARMQVIAVADIERLRADNPSGVAEIIGR